VNEKKELAGEQFRSDIRRDFIKFVENNFITSISPQKSTSSYGQEAANIPSSEAFFFWKSKSTATGGATGVGGTEDLSTSSQASEISLQVTVLTSSGTVNDFTV
jgi:hypothetical protein